MMDDRREEDRRAARARTLELTAGMSEKRWIIPPERTRYLAEIVETCEARRRASCARRSAIARRMYQLHGTHRGAAARTSGRSASRSSSRPAPSDVVHVTQRVEGEPAFLGELVALYRDLEAAPRARVQEAARRVAGDEAPLRRREVPVPGARQGHRARSRLRVALAPAHPEGLAARSTRTGATCSRGSCARAPPGQFPFTAGVFPLKREGEDPARMFAGEGGPERTNRRFHYVSRGLPAKRLSTAFDSVTLYGEDPDARPDIYGKVGNSGVSIASVDDAKKLYSGFDLCRSVTSVSMTINGPAPMLLGFFLNAAIDQSCEKWIQEPGQGRRGRGEIDEHLRARGVPRPTLPGRAPRGQRRPRPHAARRLRATRCLPREVYEKIRAATLSAVRGTVQADILKEDQAQNTCIFSTEFALRLMGDIQQYFIDNKVRNFYSVSISGYHIAEAGANPISQLAFTLANGFTFVEYYLSRGMHIDDFAPNLSFFFSNGMDPEYAVLGRVARRIWARAIRDKYGGNDRSQKLKYHIQTSGRSLHAQEIAFNDIRTTLQALLALQDNCNSLHTNAYDEAITTPTEESVRRALAIQLVISKEFGLAKNENPTPGRVHHRGADRSRRRRRCWRSSARSPSAVACSARWSGCTSARRFRTSRSTTRRCKHDGALPDRRRQHVPRSEGLADGAAARGHPRDEGREGLRDRGARRVLEAQRRARAGGPRRDQARSARRWQRLRRAHGSVQGVHARSALGRALPGRRPVPTQHVKEESRWSFRRHARRVARAGRERARGEVVRKDARSRDGRGTRDRAAVHRGAAAARPAARAPSARPFRICMRHAARRRARGARSPTSTGGADASVAAAEISSGRRALAREERRAVSFVFDSERAGAGRSLERSSRVSRRPRRRLRLDRRSARPSRAARRARRSRRSPADLDALGRVARLADTAFAGRPS